jgi:hypothetical protein
VVALKPVDHDKLAEVNESNQLLKSLQAHPGWDELRRLMKERQDRIATSLAKRVMTASLLTPDEILRNQCFWGGVNAVLDTPGHVEKKLENLIRKAKEAQPDEGDE